MGNGIETVEVNVNFLRHTSEELDEGAQLLKSLARRCGDVAADAEEWKEDVKDIHPQTYDRVREVIDFLFEANLMLNFVSRDQYQKAIEAMTAAEKRGSLRAA